MKAKFENSKIEIEFVREKISDLGSKAFNMQQNLFIIIY